MKTSTTLASLSDLFSQARAGGLFAQAALLGRALAVVQKAARAKGLPLDGRTTVTLNPSGLTVKVASAPLAQKVRNLAPSLEAALRHAGIPAAITKVQVASGLENPWKEEPAAPRAAPGLDPGTAEDVARAAALADHPAVKKALENLSRAVSRKTVR